MIENCNIARKKTQNRFYKSAKFLLYTYCSIIIATISPIYANNDMLNMNTKNKLQGILEDNRKTQIFGHDFYTLPYFYVQAGIGAKISTENNSITSSGMPTFMIGIGFWHQYYIYGFNFGYKIKLAYEIGVKVLGENTMAFRSGGGFLQIHMGYKYLLPFVSFGYETLSVGNAFIPSANETILYQDNGWSFGFGTSVLLSRQHAIEIEAKWSKIYQYTPRILFVYEFRF